MVATTLADSFMNLGMQCLDLLVERIASSVADRLAQHLSGSGDRGLVDGEEAAKLIDVPKSWLAAEARRGTFRSYKRGHYRRYDPREVIEDFKRLASSAA